MVRRLDVALLCLLWLPRVRAVKVPRKGDPALAHPADEDEDFDARAEDEGVPEDILGGIIHDMAGVMSRRRRSYAGNAPTQEALLLNPLPHDAKVIVFGDSWSDEEHDWPAQTAKQLGLDHQLWGKGGSVTQDLLPQLENATDHGLAINGNDLYVVHSGGNDMLMGWTNLSHDVDIAEIALANIPQVILSMKYPKIFSVHANETIDNLMAFVHELTVRGAKRIIVSEAPITSAVPLFNVGASIASQILKDEPNFFNTRGHYMNDKLNGRVDIFRTTHPGVDVGVVHEVHALNGFVEGSILDIDNIKPVADHYDQTFYHPSALGALKLAMAVAKNLTVASA